MDVRIVDIPFHLQIHGFSGMAMNKNYAETAFTLSGKLWQTVRTWGLKTKGMNVWVYEPGENVFAGVELEEPVGKYIGLEEKTIQLANYAYYKHIGSYKMIKVVGNEMRSVLKRKGIRTILPYIEIYGHWSEDETRLETELLMAVC